MKESVKTIRNKLIGCSLFYVGTASLAYVALTNSSFLPDGESQATWFQRSGSAIVVSAVWVQFILTKIEAYIDPGDTAYVVPFDTPAYFKNWFNVLATIMWIYLLVGTIIWGYGDLFFKNT